MSQNRKKTARMSYVYGNTARKIEPVRREKRQEEPEERRRVSERTRQNQEKALSLSTLFVMFLAVVSVAAVYVCFQYLQIQTSINNRVDNIQTMTSEISELKSNNRALQTHIETFYDLNYIYTVATQEYGMEYANPDQVIQYERSESEYVRQYDDIPD